MAVLPLFYILQNLPNIIVGMVLEEPHQIFLETPLWWSTFRRKCYINFFSQVFDIECKYVKLHASQETLWYARDPKRGIGTEVPEFFRCFRAIGMTGEKVPDKDIHISLEVLVDYTSTPLEKCHVIKVVFRISRRSTSLQGRTKSLKTLRMISRYD